MHRYGGFGTLATTYGSSKIREASDDKEFNRRKEVDDLISKYARKKAPVPAPVGPPVPVPVPVPSSGLQRDYSSSSLKFGASRDSLYGSNNLYGGASSSNLYPAHHHTRRSSQYEINYPEPIYESSTAPRQQKYLATSKSSSNLYLQPHDHRSSLRQQKTLSLHGGQIQPPAAAVPPPAGPRNNTVMETAASIIANAHQQNAMGIGSNTEWWNPNNNTFHPLQHDWSQKNVWNPPPSASANFASLTNSASSTNLLGTMPSNAGHHLQPQIQPVLYK